MNNMKRLVAVMLVLTLALCLVACAQPQPTNPTENQPTTKPTTQPTTQPTTAPTDPKTPSHSVTVVDQDGNPVAGIYVQLCDDGNCYFPVQTNESGVAEFFLENLNGPAKVKTISLEGYEADTTGTDAEGYIKFPDGSTSVTLKIIKIAE